MTATIDAPATFTRENLLATGWTLFPINGRTLNKRPTGWQEGRAFPRQELTAAPGVGVVLDKSGLAAIDIDPQNGGSLDAVLECVGALPPTFTVETPSGGTHLYFRLPDGIEELRKINGKLIPGVDFLCSGSYVAGPSSTRGAGDKPGGVYTVVDPSPLAEMPARLLAAWVAHLSAGNSRIYPTGPTETHPSRFEDTVRWHLENVQRAADAPEGERDDTAYKMICASLSLALGVPDDVLSVDDVEAAYGTLPYEVKGLDEKITRALNFVGPRTFGEVVQTSDDVFVQYTPDPTRLASLENRTASAQVDRLANMLGENVIYAGQTWYVWNGRYWQAKESLAYVVRKCCEFSWRDFRAMDDPTGDVLRTVMYYNSPSFWAAATEQLKAHPKINRHVDELDALPGLLNVANGTVDLRTGEIRPHDPNDLITKIAETTYNPDVRFDRWDRFLREIFPQDREGLPQALQDLFGYAVTGEATEHIFPILNGVGRNGKSQVIDAITETLGVGYVVPISPEALASAGQGGNPDQKRELIRLRGARLATMSETNQGVKYDEAALKRWTGEKFVTGKELYKGEVTFRKQFLAVMVTNHRPDFVSQGVALWDRVTLIEFPRVFAKHEQDKTLGAQFASDDGRARVLAWLVQGAMRFYATGGIPPVGAIQDATADYRESSNKIEAFLSACTIDGEGGVLRKPDAYKAYSKYCRVVEGLHKPELSRNAFYNVMTERGYPNVKTHGVRVFKGVRFADGIAEWAEDAYTNELPGSPAPQANAGEIPF